MTPRSSRKQSEVTRENIMNAAHALFLEQGYHATSMRQIGERAGVTLGGIYNHFSGKEEIWVAVFSERHPVWQVAPILQRVEGSTTAEVVRSAARLMVEELDKRNESVNLMLIEMVEFNARHMPLLVESTLPVFLELGRLFQRQAGELRDIPLPTLLRSFVGLFFSYYMTRRLIPLEIMPIFGGDSLDLFVDIYLHGILKREDDHA
ncbi:MAG TPA: TetR/AcrR family transcriptional regulator [Anaerolineaceae bacterium]|nr:TetR/AcrR family transcriptional regulator [Anaerolineaceae bacterium]HOD43445.1 TetR/AcrR family transcriptional regulator [Anaerolineaceae bacterium]HOU44599.1 TetR/AcrR family transcriptional regulator [Anaerolineaceae bacterium]HQF45290.1 TetR/AcrR family transcriptional regulator [Anaerolineaceae bacterium]HQH35748.1 TetR/AcrR family transcriptional regulator [Anaerolineaceae bacterium]